MPMSLALISARTLMIIRFLPNDWRESCAHRYISRWSSLTWRLPMLGQPTSQVQASAWRGRETEISRPVSWPMPLPLWSKPSTSLTSYGMEANAKNADGRDSAQIHHWSINFIRLDQCYLTIRNIGFLHSLTLMECTSGFISLKKQTSCFVLAM